MRSGPILLHAVFYRGHRAHMSIGFKEWALICDALGRGEQSIILRKGGIAEGRAGFRFQHERFLLFPTLFHEQVAKLKLPPETSLPAVTRESEHTIHFAAQVQWTLDLTDLTSVHRFAPFHLWRDEVIEERYRYDEKEGVSLAFVRVFKLNPAFTFPDSPRFRGCRSWLDLPDPASDTRSEPVLTDATHLEREQAIRALL